MDDALDESGPAGGVREDGMPLGEGEIGGEDEALLLVTSTDDLEEEVCIAIVECEETEPVNDESSNL